MRMKLWEEWNNILLLEKASPYVFRTKLERVINHTIIYANREGNDQLLRACQLITHRLISFAYMDGGILHERRTYVNAPRTFFIKKTHWIYMRPVEGYSLSRPGKPGQQAQCFAGKNSCFLWKQLRQVIYDCPHIKDNPRNFSEKTLIFPLTSRNSYTILFLLQRH